MKYRLRFDKERCVGCYACYVACQDAHNLSLEENTNSRRVIRRVIDKDYEKNICPGCIHCGRCMEACPEHAVYRDEETGFILTDQEKCTGCRTCESVCPIGVIHFSKNGKMEKCDGCIGRLGEGREPACVNVCCIGAVKLERV